MIPIFITYQLYDSIDFNDLKTSKDNFLDISVLCWILVY